MNNARVEAFSDGVFAIVITLLILEIRVPEVDPTHLAEALGMLLPRIAAYVMSFGVIGLYWVGHHRTLHLVSKTDGVLLWLNLLYLLVVSFMPFPTALLGRYPLQPLPIVIYAVNLIAANLTGLLSVLYVMGKPDLRNHALTINRPQLAVIYLFVNGSYGLAIAICGIAPIVSYLIFATVLLLLIGFYATSASNLPETPTA